MQNKSEMINRIAELAEENAKLNAIIDGYQPKIQALKVEIAELQAYKDVNEDFKTAWEEIKAENDRLKAEIKNNKSAYQVELGTYNMECGNLLEENKQLLQTLQEIKEIAKADVRIVGDEKFYYDSIEEILQVITKAEEE